MVFRVAWVEFEDLAKDPLVDSSFLPHVTDGRIRVWRQKNTAYTQEHSANCPLRWSVSGMIASWTWSPYEMSYNQLLFPITTTTH